LGVPFVLALADLPWTQALAAGAQPASLPQEQPGQLAAAPTVLVGTLIAVVPDSRTIVVDVPLEKGVLRLGAIATDTARIAAEGKPVALDALAPGARVRIEFRRTPTGDEATAIEVLQAARG
jgi:hypothetical protein